MAKVQLRCEAGDENPKLVSFPGGVPLQAQHMAITAQAKGLGKKRKFDVEGLPMSSCHFSIRLIDWQGK
jgi:hypothetical protein